MGPKKSKNTLKVARKVQQQTHHSSSDDDMYSEKEPEKETEEEPQKKPPKKRKKTLRVAMKVARKVQQQTHHSSSDDDMYSEKEPEKETEEETEEEAQKKPPRSQTKKSQKKPDEEQEEPEEEPEEEVDDENSSEEEEGTSEKTKKTKKISRSKKPSKPSVQFTEEVEVQLAEWLRNTPMLYDKSHAQFKLSKKKEGVWGEKALMVGLQHWKELETWYRSIRSRISRWKNVSASGSGAKKLTARAIFINANFGFLKDMIGESRGRTAVQLVLKPGTTPTEEELSKMALGGGCGSAESSETEANDIPADLEADEEEVPADTEADVPSLPKTGKGKAGGRAGKTKGKRNLPARFDVDSDPDPEMGRLMKEMTRQQNAAAAIHTRIQGLLTADQVTTTQAWGVWMGTLAQQVDIRLHADMYHQATNMMMGLIAQSGTLNCPPPVLLGNVPLHPNVPLDTNVILDPNVPLDANVPLPQPAGPSYIELQPLHPGSVAWNSQSQQQSSQSSQSQPVWITPAPAAGANIPSRRVLTPPVNQVNPVNLSAGSSSFPSFSNISSTCLPDMDGSFGTTMRSVMDQDGTS